MVAHTPAPWTLTADPYEDGTPYFRIEGGDAASEDTSTMGFRAAAIMREADARLIAAAPDLLAALRKAWRELNTIRAADGVPYTAVSGIISKSSVDEQYFSDVVDECRAAIAKAQAAP